MTLGLVCDACDALSPLSATICSGCGDPLGVPPPRSAGSVASPPGPVLSPSPVPRRPATDRNPAAPTVRPPPAERVGDTAPGEPSIDEPGAQCASCGGDLVPGHRFCGHCGGAIEPVLASRDSTDVSSTQYFGAMMVPGKAKLILIKGDGQEDGTSYHLAGREHIAGRSEGAILFPDDPLLSPRHVCFLYSDDGRLMVRDEASANGVFIRIKAPAMLEPGAHFLVGEQLLRLAVQPPETAPTPDAEGTYFYGSPRRPARLCLVHVLLGGIPGLVYPARANAISLGREGNDLNFPDDPFISGRHAQISALDGDRFELADLGSKNGTFLQVREAALAHGDYVFVGQQLLRVEVPEAKSRAPRSRS